MSSHDYYKDLEPSDFDSDDEYLEERVKQTISENSPLTIACKIKADHHQQFREDVLISSMQKHFPSCTEIPHLTKV